MLCLLALSPLVAQEALVPRAMDLRLTQDRVVMPDPGERMDLTGLTLLHPLPGGWSVGTSLYGATRGRRGGFFTGGFAAHWGHDLGSRFRAETGLFLGGGGGSSALVGGGLMLRGHLGLAWQGEQGRAGLQWSRIHFPNGAVGGSQVALVLERRLQTLAFPTLAGTGGRWPGFDAVGQAFTLSLQRYERPGGLHDVQMKPGTPTPSLVGFAWTRQTGPRSFLAFEMAAATLGQSDGYMEGFAGPGLRLPLGAGFSATARLLAGAGGGGRLGVGGGFLLKGLAGLDYQHPSGFVAALEAGRLESPSTPFGARVLAVRTGWHYGTPSVRSGAPARTVGSLVIQARPFYQRFAHAQRQGSPTRDALPVESIGLKLEALLGPWFYLSGLATGATTGQAGGWATGMLGVGAQSSPWRGFRLLAEGHAGAGGGGGLSTEGGLLLRTVGGLAWEPSPAWGIQALTGRIHAPRGRFDSPLIEVALVLRSRRPILSPRP